MNETELKVFKDLEGKTISKVLVGEFGDIMLLTNEKSYIISYERDYGLTCRIFEPSIEK